jgi:hypothetical protein
VKIKILIIIALFVSTGLYSEDLNYKFNFEAIDGRVAGLPGNIDSLDTLAADIKKIAGTDIEKARAIYKWMTDNIRYDYDKLNAFEGGKADLFNDNRSIDQIALDAFKNRRGVCGEMSYLYMKIADKADLENFSVLGWLLTYTKKDDPSYMNNFKGFPDHRWNAVKAGNKWFLVDCSARDFFLPPDEMIKDHYPVVPFWQLLKEKSTADVPMGPPLELEGAKKIKAELLSPKNCLNYIRKGDFTVDLKGGAGLKIYGYIIKNSDVKNYKVIMPVYNGGVYKFVFNFRNADEKDLNYLVLSDGKDALYLILVVAG